MPGSGAAVRGRAVLTDPLLNRGTAFTEQERRDLGPDGQIPPRVLPLDRVHRAMWEPVYRPVVAV